MLTSTDWPTSSTALTLFSSQVTETGSGGGAQETLTKSGVAPHVSANVGSACSTDSGTLNDGRSLESYTYPGAARGP